VDSEILKDGDEALHDIEIGAWRACATGEPAGPA
jgi:hypothetical protein